MNMLGADNNLSLNRREIMKQLALGIDEKQRKLLIVQKTADGKYDWRIINIDLLKVHFLKKTYSKVNASDLERGILEEYLEKVCIYLEFSDGNPPFEIIFFDHVDHNIFEFSELEQLARAWNMIINKVITGQPKCNANLSNYKSQLWQGY
jgi:hypothetical protein